MLVTIMPMCLYSLSPIHHSRELKKMVKDMMGKLIYSRNPHMLPYT